MKLVVRFTSVTKLGIVSLDTHDRPRIRFRGILVNGSPVLRLEREGPAPHLLRGAIEITVVKRFPTGPDTVQAAPTVSDSDLSFISSIPVAPAEQPLPSAAAPCETADPAPTPATSTPVPTADTAPSPTPPPAPTRPPPKPAPPSPPKAPAREPKVPTQPTPPAERTRTPQAAAPPPYPSGATSTTRQLPPRPREEYTALFVERANAGLSAVEALSGVPESLRPDQLFRQARITTPDALQGLTGAYLKFAVAQPQPTDIPEAAREALVESTRSQHMNYLKRVAKEINPDQPLDRALVSTLQILAARHNWRHSTQLKAAASVQGAFKILPLYFANTASILLRDFPIWRLSLVTFGQRSKQELPSQPKAATWDQVSSAVSACKNDAQAMALLLGWLTAARLGCVRQLTKADIKWSAQHTLIRFSKGKSARIRGPYTVHAQPIPPEFRDRWTNFFGQRDTVLFPRHVTGKSLKEALRHIDPELEQRSIRRGALQAMALCDVDEETLMRYSGHTQVSTLRRYLNWNATNSKVQKDMTEAGKPLVRKTRTPGE